MAIADFNEARSSKCIEVEIFTSRAEMEEFVTRLKADSGIAYAVTVYPAEVTDAKIPVNQFWSGGESYTVVAQETKV